MAQYKAGADENNKLVYVEVTIYSDSGFSFFEDTSSYAAHYAEVILLYNHFLKIYLYFFV